MRHRILVLTALASVFCVGAFAASKPLLNEPLVWKPTSDISVPVGQTPGAVIQVLPFTNVSENPTQIGENREDDKPKPVTTSDDAGAFVANQVRGILRQYGWNVSDQAPTLILSGEVRRFFVTETNTYDGSVIFHIVAKTPAGKVLWDGVTSGSAKRFGRSYKLENYYEALSDSIIDATAQLARSEDFRAVLAKAAVSH